MRSTSTRRSTTVRLSALGGVAALAAGLALTGTVATAHPDHQAENRELVALSDLVPGDRATVVRLAEHDGDLLHWFYDEGLAPGTPVEVAKSDDGTLTVVAGGREHAVQDRQAAGLFVRRAA